MDGLSISPQGQISVEYTVTGAAATPFSIGIYGSPDGKTPENLLQTIDVTDSSQLSPGTYTAAVDAALAQMTEADYLLAKLDIYNEANQQNLANDTSAPWSGMFEQDDGTLYVLGSATNIVNDDVTLTQDVSSGNITVNVTDQWTNPLISQVFAGVSAVTISTPGGGNTITVDPSVTVPVSVFGGSGTSVSGPTTGNEGAILANGPATITEGHNCTLTLKAAVGDGTISSWTINWGDGSYPQTVQSTSPSHQYTSGSGLYNISVSALDTDGITYTAPDTIPVAVLPAAPTGLSATAVSGSNGAIQLSWTNNSQVATGYEIEQSTDGTNFTTATTVSGYLNSYTVGGLTASTHYYFCVCAVDAAGQSAYTTDDTTTNGTSTGTLPTEDDNPSELADLGMNLDFYGTQFSQVWVNNNGNITIGSALSTYTPSDPLATRYGAIIAPFFADVDTRDNHGTVTYQSTTVGGRSAFEVDWNNVDYYNVTTTGHVNLQDTFSVTLVDRSDVSPGDFDIIFNYNGLQWDTGDASGGQNGQAGQNGYPARAGYSNGSGENGTYFELSGSGQSGGLLGTSGSQTFQIRNASVSLTAHRTGGNYGAAVSTADQQSGDPSNYVILVDDNTDQAGDGTTTDIAYNTEMIVAGQAINLTDQDLARITLQQVQPAAGQTLDGTVSLALSNVNSARIFDANGHLLSSSDLSATIGGSGYLAGLANGNLNIFVEGLAADPNFSLTYSYSGSGGSASTSVHLAIADVSFVDINGSVLSVLEPNEDVLSNLPSPTDGGSLAEAYQSSESNEYRTQIAGLHSDQIQQVTVVSDAGDRYQDSMTDWSGGAESASFAVIVDNGGQALIPAQQSQIRSLYGLNALDPSVTSSFVTITLVTGAGDTETRKVAVAQWSVLRNYQPYAEVVCTKGATIAQLAAKLQLDGTTKEQYQKWLTLLPGGTMPASPDTPLEAATTFKVPNLIYAVWAGEGHATGRTLVNFSGPGTAPIGILDIPGRKSDVAYLEALGFDVVVEYLWNVAKPNQKPHWVLAPAPGPNGAPPTDGKSLLDLIGTASANKSLTGFFYWGHGWPDSISSSGGWVVYYSDIVAILKKYYKLDFVLLNCCLSGFQGGEKDMKWLGPPEDLLGIIHKLFGQNITSYPGELPAGGADLIYWLPGTDPEVPKKWGTVKFYGSREILSPTQRVPFSQLKLWGLYANHEHPWELLNPGDLGTKRNVTP